MKMMPLDNLGAHVSGTRIRFGALLPGVDWNVGYLVEVRMIHQEDQFIQTEPAYRHVMIHSVNPVYGDFWEATVDLALPGSGAHWGQPGEYVYRFAVRRPDGHEIDFIIDPFARQFGTGLHAAFTYGYLAHVWAASEATWRTPRHHDLVLYEMNLMEFAGSLGQAIDKLGYLRDLGINCISLMPVTNITDVIDWGYTPIGYFGVDERFGRRDDFQKFVEAAHQQGIAVLVDAIYGHTSGLFAYEYLYRQLPGLPNPIMGSFSKDMFSPSVDWGKAFAEDFFYSVNQRWLEVFHVDGFRYDCVPNYWELDESPRGYASIAYHTYQLVKSQLAAGNPDYQRFDDGAAPLRFIQCAEQLEAVGDVLYHTYSTCTWQNGTISSATQVARGESGAIERLGFALAATGLPTERTVNGDRIFKSPLQYIENHDQSRFICHFGVENPDELKNPLFERGYRSNWYKVQPYLVGLLMAKGIPLLWQGQEFCENNNIVSSGSGRVGFLRVVHWEYFYDDIGRNLLSLVRRLLKVRAALTHARDGEFYFFNDYDKYLRHGTLLFARYHPGTADYTLIALNFTGSTVWVPFWFPVGGTYREELHGIDDPSLNLTAVPALAETWLELPPNYGRVWTHV